MQSKTNKQTQRHIYKYIYIYAYTVQEKNFLCYKYNADKSIVTNE